MSLFEGLLVISSSDNKESNKKIKLSATQFLSYIAFDISNLKIIPNIFDAYIPNNQQLKISDNNKREFQELIKISRSAPFPLAILKIQCNYI